MDVFKQAMMEMRAQEQPKECDHDWRHLSDGIKMCYKCCNHDWKHFSNGFKVCSKCYKERRPSIFHHHAPSDENYSRCVFRKKSTYTKEKHFNDTLDIFLCYKDLKEYVVNFARSLPNNITKAEIRQEIKKKRKTGLARFLRNIHWIATGIEPKPSKMGDESRVRRDFIDQENELTKSLGERKNSINVRYKMYKLFQHNGVDVDIEDFPLPKPKKLIKRVRKDHGKGLGDSWNGSG